MHLLPKLAALKHYPPYALMLSEERALGDDWVPVSWQEIRERRKR